MGAFFSWLFGPSSDEKIRAIREFLAEEKFGGSSIKDTVEKECGLQIRTELNEIPQRCVQKSFDWIKAYNTWAIFHQRPTIDVTKDKREWEDANKQIGELLVPALKLAKINKMPDPVMSKKNPELSFLKWGAQTWLTLQPGPGRGGYTYSMKSKGKKKSARKSVRKSAKTKKSVRKTKKNKKSVCK